MKITLPQQLTRQDFPEAPNWLAKLLYPLQLFQSTIVSALTSQLTLQDNVSCRINDLTFVAGATPELNTFSFVWNLPRQPICMLMHVTASDGTTPPIYPIPSWNLVGSNIQVNGIQGLTNTVSYHIVTVVL